MRERKSRHPVIKEVNPLAVSWIIDLYKPKIVYFLRRPAAVANIFFQLGWVGEQFLTRVTTTTIDSWDFDYRRYKGSFWMEHGAMQAVVLQLTLEALRDYPAYLVVKCEDLCERPIESYRKLYTFASLKWQDGLEEQLIALSDSNQHIGTGEYGVRRNSLELTRKWKAEILEEAVRDLKEADLSLSPA